MRKFFKLVLMCMAGAFIAPACIDHQAAPTAGVETVVKFHLEIDNGPVTRAISDGKSADKLVLAIFTEDGNLVSKGEKNVSAGLAVSSEVSMTVTLSASCTYKAVIWAQSSKCEAYTISDDMVVSVDYTGVNNDENRDAFFGVSDPFILSESAVSVTLKRPFAQLNIGTFPFDWEFVKGYHKFDVTKSSVRIHEVPDQINLMDGSVSGSTDVVFSPGLLPSEFLLADVDENGEDEEYVYLSMSYVLASEEESSHFVDVCFMDDNNKAVMFENEGLADVPLQRNSKTDFVGQVLTNSGALNFREYSQVESVYHNVSEETVISDMIYNMTDYGGLAFASESGQKITLNNVYITGDIWTIELGEYRGTSYVNYNNELNDVVLHNLNTTSCIECHEWYFSPAVIAYGNTVLNNCEMTGATTVCEPVTDKHGVVHEVIPIDFGVRNESDAVINGGVFGNVFAWTHAVVDIYAAVIDTLYCGTCDSTKHSWMTIHSGTKIDKVICCEPRRPYGTKEYSTTMTIKSGAEIGSLQLVSTDVEFLIIEAGAKVGKITCEGVEYTYEELRSAMGL